MSQCLKNIKYVFGMCVFDFLKSWHRGQNNIFYLRREKKSILYCCPSFLISVPSFSLLFPKSKKPNPHCRSPHLHRRSRRPMVGLHVPRISSPLSAPQDPTTNQDFLAVEANVRRCHFNTNNPQACYKSRFESHFHLGC